MSEESFTGDPDPLSKADLEVVVELQKAELDRLLRDNARLHERIGKLLAMQEREQILRQQMQTLLGDATANRKQLDDGAGLQVRARVAETRYGRLKQAMILLIDAMERSRR